MYGGGCGFAAQTQGTDACLVRVDWLDLPPWRRSATDAPHVRSPHGVQVREEQERLRPDLSAPVTGEVLNEMHYTRQVVKEILRYKPAAPMVPQVGVPPGAGEVPSCHPVAMRRPWCLGGMAVERARFKEQAV